MRILVAIVTALVVPRLALAQAPSLRHLAVGEHHACTITSKGVVTCWGRNASGQLGDGTREDAGFPVAVVGLSNAIEVVAGSLHSCALVRDGTVSCWGGNTAGQAAEPMDTLLATPRPVGGLPPSSRIFAGPWSTCALGRDGKVRCWGRTPMIGKPTSTPTEVPGLANIIDITHPQWQGAVACAAVADGIQCWGEGVPKKIAISKVARMASTSARIVVLTTDGGTKRIDLDLGKKTAKVSELTGAKTVRDIAGRPQGQCTLDVRGPVQCTDQLARLKIDGANAVEIGVGETHACVLRNDGSYRCWGQPGAELGDAAPLRQAVRPGRPAPSVAPACTLPNLPAVTTVFDGCPRSGGVCHWTELMGMRMDLVISKNETAVALLQQSGACHQLRVARFGRDLAMAGISSPFGPGDAMIVLVSATSSGVLVATTSGESTAIYHVASNGTVTGPSAIVRGQPATLVEGPAGGPSLLVLMTGGDHQRDNGRVALEVVLLDPQGKAISATIPVFAQQGFAYQSTPAGVWVGDAFLVVREQDAPGSDLRTAVARIEKDGKVSARNWISDPSANYGNPSITYDGSAARVFSQRLDTVCSTGLDRSGQPTGKPECTPSTTGRALFGVVVASKGPWLIFQNRTSAGPWAQPLEVDRVASDGKLVHVDVIGSRGIVATTTNRAPEIAAWRTTGDALVIGWLSPAARLSEPASLWLARIGGP